MQICTGALTGQHSVFSWPLLLSATWLPKEMPLRHGETLKASSSANLKSMRSQLSKVIYLTARLKQSHAAQLKRTCIA